MTPLFFCSTGAQFASEVCFCIMTFVSKCSRKILHSFKEAPCLTAIRNKHIYIYKYLHWAGLFALILTSYADFWDQVILFVHPKCQRQQIIVLVVTVNLNIQTPKAWCVYFKSSLVSMCEGCLINLYIRHIKISSRDLMKAFVLR